MKWYFAIFCLVLSACTCWDLSDNKCQEDKEFFENERERDSRLCTDPVAYQKCVTEQEERYRLTQQTETVDIDSWCRENTEKVKCIDLE